MGKQEAKTFLENTKPALNHLYEAVEHYYVILKRAETTLEQIEGAQDTLSDIFMYRDQWSPNANYYHSQYVQRMKKMEEEKQSAALPQEERIEKLLSEIGSTNESLSCLTGTVLQLAKQTLSIAYGAKGNLPSSPSVGSQSMSEVIWEGRNHSMHWEEGSPRTPIVQMFQNLTNDFGITVNPSENNCLSILGAMKWKSADVVVEDLENLLT